MQQSPGCSLFPSSKSLFVTRIVSAVHLPLWPVYLLASNYASLHVPDLGNSHASCLESCMRHWNSEESLGLGNITATSSNPVCSIVAGRGEGVMQFPATLHYKGLLHVRFTSAGTHEEPKLVFMTPKTALCPFGCWALLPLMYTNSLIHFAWQEAVWTCPLFWIQ